MTPDPFKPILWTLCTGSFMVLLFVGGMAMREPKRFLTAALLVLAVFFASTITLGIRENTVTDPVTRLGEH